MLNTFSQTMVNNNNNNMWRGVDILGSIPQLRGLRGEGGRKKEISFSLTKDHFENL